MRRRVTTGLLAAVVAVALGLLEAAGEPDATVEAGTVGATVVLAAAIGLAPLRPRPAWMLGLAGFAWLALSAPAVPIASELLAFVCVFQAGRYDGGRWSAASGLGMAAVAEAVSLAAHQDAIGYSFLIPFLWFAGRSVREREVLAGRLADRARELAGEREAYAALSVRYERARVASELHDIVAHAMSIMVVQAAAGQRLVGVEPELTAEAFAAIRGAATQAEADMGRLVALLGDDGALGAAPDLDLIRELVRRASGSGLDVELRLEGEREGLPAPVVEAACRVVQESLTNALRYAAGAAVHVAVRGDGEALRSRWSTARRRPRRPWRGPGRATGCGACASASARAAGALEAGPFGDGGWRVAARLPRRVLVAG